MIVRRCRSTERLAFGLVSAWLLIAGSWSNPLHAANRALLIGIGENPGLERLPGVAGDLELIGRALRDRLGFEDLRQLRDADATRTGIEREFEHLAAAVADGDSVYIHFSGYGSRGAGAGQQRPWWVTYGGRAARGDGNGGTSAAVRDIAPADVDRWLAPVLAKAAQVVVVSDAGDQVIPYLAEGVVNRAAAAKASPPSVSAPSGRQAVRITAARPHDIARGAKPVGELTVGWFTADWVQALNTAPTGATWDQVFEMASMSLSAGSDGLQVPTYDGPRGLPLPGAGTSDSRFRVTVTGVDPGRSRIRLDRGLLEGVTKGSVFGSASPSSSGVKVTIVQVGVTDSFAEVIQGRPKPGDVLVETKHRYRQPQYKVYVDAGSFAERASKQIEELGPYTVVPDLADADYHVKLAHTGDDPIGSGVAGAPLPPEEAGAPLELWILSASGQQIAPNLRMSFADPKRGLQLLRTNLLRLARYKDFKTLFSYRQGRVYFPPARVGFSILTADERCGEPAQCLDIPGYGKHRVERAVSPEALKSRGLGRNQIVSLTLTNQGDEPLYFYVVNLGPNGQVAPIFPYPEDLPDLARLGPGLSLDLFEQGYGLLLETAGVETLKVIAAQRGIDIGTLEQEGYQRRGGDSNLNALERLLASRALGTRSQDPIPALPGESWGVMDVEFLVR